MRERIQTAFGGRGRAAAVLCVLALGLGLRLDYAVRAPEAQVDDARAYARIARALHRGEGLTQGEGPGYRHLQPASDYAPGLPLLTAGLYAARGAADERAARIVLALLSSLAVPLSFLLGKRLGGPNAGLIATLPVAIHPALLEYSGMLMTEPIASALLVAAVLAFLWAADGSAGPARWLAPGVLLGAMALVRPEYLVVGVVFALLAAIRVGRARGRRPAAAATALFLAAFLLPIVPWTARNLIVLDRLVPISTGTSQLLYQGSYLPAGPDPERIGPVLLDRHPWIERELGPAPGPIYRGQAVTLLAARTHPGEDPDAALRSMALRSYRDALVEEPLTLTGFLAGKVWLAWTGAARGTMRLPPWRAMQLLLLAAAAVGLAVGLARRSFEATVLAALFLAVTAIQAIFIASPRRTLVLAPEISALAGFGFVWAAARLRRAAAPSPPIF